jgi:hypothetical protein
MSFQNCKELQDFIKSGTGLRTVFIDSWEGTIQPPYIVVSKARTDTVKADNKNYAKENRYYVSLFVKKTDTETPEQLEELFESNEIIYDTEVYWLNDLRLECHEFEI